MYMPITKKTYIDNSIFKELNIKYPPIDAENGVAYKQKLDYLTFETDFLTDTTLRNLRNQYDNDIIAVIFYLRTEMCKNGWKVRMDNESFYGYLVNDCSYICHIEPNKVHAILQDLINHRIFFCVQDTSVEEGVWLTCPQQVYNYEMACNNRQNSRARNARKRMRQTEQKNLPAALPPANLQQFSDLPDTANGSTIEREEDPFNIL